MFAHGALIAHTKAMGSPDVADFPGLADPPTDRLVREVLAEDAPVAEEAAPVEETTEETPADAE